MTRYNNRAINLHECWTKDLKFLMQEKYQHVGVLRDCQRWRDIRFTEGGGGTRKGKVKKTVNNSEISG